MVTLIIYQGSENLRLPKSDHPTYLYRIGTGTISGRHCEDINDSFSLNNSMICLRDKYTQWIFSLNKQFLEADLIRKGLSLFFLTDLSNKRPEIFDTFNTLVNIDVIRKNLKGIVIDSVILVGVDTSFAGAIISVFPNASFSRVRPRRTRIVFWRRILADIKYLIEAATVIAINAMTSKPKEAASEFSDKKKYYFSIYPQTFRQDNTDLRFGNLVTSGDRFLVSIIADGMHQQVSPIRYWQLVKTLPSCKFCVVDQGMRLTDIAQSVYWFIRLHVFLLRQQSTKYVFGGVDLSGYIREEMLWSISRVTRLVIFSNSLSRTIGRLEISELIYIVFEFPLGRAISYVLGKEFPSIIRTGFNHADYSWRFLNYFMAEGEAGISPPYLERCPIPDRIMAEDTLSAEIYRYNGYKNVSVMSQVHRLSYLEGIVSRKESNISLIAPGLHDGGELIKALHQLIVNNPKQTFILKAHPRGGRDYIDKIPLLGNLELSEEPIEALLTRVGRVYVSYSSVGLEAHRLGIPVSLVLIPGKICWSKLLDFQAKKGVSIYSGFVTQSQGC